MDIEITAAESLGVRGLSCMVNAGERHVLIDPGMALGYQRDGLLPHPVQVAAGEDARHRILQLLPGATDIVISHFHGDHVPLSGANPYQMSLKSAGPLMPKDARYWTAEVSAQNSKGDARYRDFCEAAGQEPLPANVREDGGLSFSLPVPHGVPDSFMGTVMMTCMEDGHDVFVHASDIQLLADEPVSLILDWAPTLLLVGGPPVYRGLSVNEAEMAWKRARLLADHVEVCIMDHHLLRCEEGSEWLDGLNAASAGEVICAADFMGRPRRFLEARRAELYALYPVPGNWHERYAQGLADTSAYRFLDLH